MGLAAWLKQLGFLVLFGCLVELILPKSEVRQAVRLLTGLVIILAVIEPIPRLRLDPSLLSWREAASPAGAVEIERGREIAAAGVELLGNLWLDRFEEELAVMISLIDGVEGVEVEAEAGEGGSIRRVSIDLLVVQEAGDAARARDPTGRVTALVRRLLPEIDPDAIRIHIRTVEDEARAGLLEGA